MVPDSLFTPGVHTVAFRVSAHHAVPIGLGSWNLFYLEEYRESMREDLVLTAKNFVLAGVYLMAALYYLFLYLLRKREAVGLIFSILCFLFFGLIVLEYTKFLYAYPYHLHFHRLFCIFLLTFFVSFLIPYFFLRYFKLPYQRVSFWSILLGLLIISFSFLPGTDTTSQYLSLFMWVSSLLISIIAVVKKRKESRLVLGTVILSGAVVFFNYAPFYRALMFSYDVNLFIGFSILVLCMMYLLARRAREQKQAL